MSDDFKLIKAGHSGTGILIEQDSGFINPLDERNTGFISEVNNIYEGKDVDLDRMVLFVVLQKYGVLNRNGRLYSEAILKREADKYQELINTRRAVGESDHPESSIISNDRISHEIRKIWWEGKTLVGEIEIVTSPGFIKQGIISCEGDRIANYLRRGICACSRSG